MKEMFSMQKQEMDDLLYQLLWSQLQSLGICGEKQVVLTEQGEQQEIRPFYHRWLHESMRLLAQQKQVSFNCNRTDLKSSDNCTVGDTIQINSASLWQDWDRCKERWLHNADLKAQVVLVETMLRALPAILTEALPATDVMFPNGSMELVEGIYQHNRVSDDFNEVLSTLSVTYLQERLAYEANVRIRLLELGAGTGVTTSQILEKLQPYQSSIAEYCYSDISLAFLHHGQESYGAKNPFLTCQFLDVERPLLEQGVQPESYDLVIASNVLHATRNIRHTLRNIKPALKKHGLLLLNEITDTNLVVHLTFGLLEGWWAYEDPELRIPASPILTMESWQAVLKDEGFGAIYIPTWEAQQTGTNEQEEATVPTGQQVIIAESDGIIKSEKSNEWSWTSPTEQMLKDHIHSIIVESMAEVLKVQERAVQKDTNFSEYGIDSIVASRLVNVINQKSNLTLQTTVLFNNKNVAQLIQYMLQEHATTLKASLQASASPVRVVEDIQETQPIHRD